MIVDIIPVDLDTSSQVRDVAYLMAMFKHDLFDHVRHPQHIDIDHAIETARNISQDGRLIAALAYHGSTVAGFIAAAHGPGFLTPKAIAEELAFYVLPEQRQTGAGLALLRWLVSEARDRGVQELYLGNKHPDMFDAVDKVFVRLGFHPQHATYRKDL